MRRPISLAAALTLIAAPAAQAQPPARSTPMADAVARQATSADAAPKRGPMHRGLKWTGWSLVAGGALEALNVASDDCNRARGWCRGRQTRATVGSAALLGTGATLLLVGLAKRSPAPAVAVEDGRLMLRQRLSF